jgi:endonuclease/exonuclease/phosphatase family metal-dependent hydrolase
LAVLTYNIRYDNPGDGEDAWPKRRDFLAAQLRFHAPNIFGIQEGLHRQLEYLDEQLPAYARVGVGRDDGKQGGEYSALYFLKKRFGLLDSGTFWLSETPDTVSKGWDAALPRVCTFAHLHDSLSGKKLWVFNTHFDHIGKEARRRSAELILLKIKEKNTAGEPVVLMGDFNAEPNEAPIAVLTRDLRDARFVSEEPPFGPEGTFNAFNFHDPVKRRIDYIFLNEKGLKVKKHAVLSDSRDCHYPSDHLPVMAVLAWGIERK